MRVARLDAGETSRRRIGRGVAVAATGLSGAGLITLWALWGWDSLARTDASYFAVLGLGFGALTWVLVAARSDNGAVWAVAWAALFSSLFIAGLATALVLSRERFPGLTLDELRGMSPAELPRSAAIALHFRFWAVVPALWLPLTFGLLLFPDGRLPSPRWRVVAWWSAIAIGVTTLATAVVHNPWSALPVSAAENTVDSPAGLLIDMAFLLSSLAAVASAASLLVRYRRSAGPTRGQIRWIGWGGALYILTLTVGGTLEDSVGDGVPADLLGVGAFAVLIVCWGVAITKYRLFDIDVIVSKSVTYLGLGAAITVLYAAVVTGPLLVLGRSSVGDPGLVLPIAATAVVAVLFEPIRFRMQRWANRLVYGKRASPYEVLSSVTARLSDSSVENGVDGLARLLAEGTGAEQAVVWLRNGDVLRPEGVFPVQVAESIAPVALGGLADDEFTGSRLVLHRGELSGAVSVTKPRNDQITPADRELLSDVAAGAGLLLRNISLNRELQERADDVRASRRRLIAAQDAERHRLERDLHDGAQQQVVALKVKLGIARTIAEREGADEIVDRVSALAEETQQAVDALRAVAHGIYPPLLESEGLGAALRAIERTSPVPLTVHSEALARYGRPMEETIYFCVLEVVERSRMAGATEIQVELVDRAGNLAMAIDVRGQVNELDLTAASDRIDAAGGTMAIESEPGHRTRITTALPARRAAMEPT